MTSSVKKSFLFLDKHLGIVLIIPGVVTLAMLIAYPIGLAVWDSFRDAHLIYPGASFVGLENYVRVVSNRRFYISLINAVVWTCSSVALQLVIGLAGALALQKISRARSFYRTVLILPWTLPTIALALTWRWMLDAHYGIVNQMLLSVGLIQQPVGWFGSAERAMLSVVLMHGWFGVPFMLLGILAGLQTIPQDLYNVATVDGASALQKLWYVILPGLKEIIGIILLLRVIWTFNNFDSIFLTTGGGPADITLTPPIMIYKIAWRDFWVGEAASLSVILLLIMIGFSVFLLKLFKTKEA